MQQAESLLGRIPSLIPEGKKARARRIGAETYNQQALVGIETDRTVTRLILTSFTMLKRGEEFTTGYEQQKRQVEAARLRMERRLGFQQSPQTEAGVTEHQIAQELVLVDGALETLIELSGHNVTEPTTKQLIEQYTVDNRVKLPFKAFNERLIKLRLMDESGLRLTEVGEAVAEKFWLATGEVGR